MVQDLVAGADACIAGGEDESQCIFRSLMGRKDIVKKVDAIRSYPWVLEGSPTNSTQSNVAMPNAYPMLCQIVPRNMLLHIAWTRDITATATHVVKSLLSVKMAQHKERHCLTMPVAAVRCCD
jgi:hypothetical protein